MGARVDKPYLVVGGELPMCGVRVLETCHWLPAAGDVYDNELVNDIEWSASYEDLINLLKRLEQRNLNIIGSKGIVYHTGVLKELLTTLSTADTIFSHDVLCFPRTAGLREKVIQLISVAEQKVLML